MDTCLDSLAHNTCLNYILARLRKIHLYSLILKACGRATDLEYGDLANLAKKLYPDEPKGSKQRLKSKFHYGGKLKKICGEQGLVMMIPPTKKPPFHVSFADYELIHARDIDGFRELMNTSRVFSGVSKMASLFVDCILKGSDVPHFVWEDLDTLEKFYDVSERELLPYLEQR